MVTLLCHHRHHCTIKQPSLAQRQRTGNRPFLIATILLNNANPFAEASLLGILLLFGYIIVYHRHHCTIKQTSLAQRQRTGIRPFLLHRYYQTHRQDLCRSKYFRHIAFVWLNCVSSPPPLHNQTNFRCTKTKDGQMFFFIAPILPNTQARPLQKQVFPCTLICFATQLHLHCLVQKNRTA